MSERAPRAAGKQGPVRLAKVAVISPARVAAFEILERVATTSDHSDDLLHGRRLAGLSQADRNLATALVLGVLRWQIALDARIRPLLQRPELGLAQPIVTALRMGLFQLLHLDRVPAHAALSESVELVRAAGHAHAAGMVNAILRKVTRSPEVKKPLFESSLAVAERLGHPAWMVERWVAAYGRNAAISICEYDQQEPGDGELFGAESMTSRLDDGSRLVAELAAVSRPGAKRIWDCCAAPGGKTLVLAGRFPEAEILATDLNPKRLAAMEERLKRDGLGANVRLLAADATALPESEGLFDLILCDVPCSGTGTLARNPEIRHHLRPSDLGRQVERQVALLRAALGRLAPGGRLMYSTCSLETEENEGVVGVVHDVPLRTETEGLRFPMTTLRSMEEVVAELSGREVLAEGKDVSGLVRGGFLRTLPGVGFRGDGFFAAMFGRE